MKDHSCPSVVVVLAVQWFRGTLVSAADCSLRYLLCEAVASRAHFSAARWCLLYEKAESDILCLHVVMFVERWLIAQMPGTLA